ncbi:hypothetical protein PHJA_001274700 [Phtheirospermum japonicum]|uniref:Uncharacterized protein n=1 Tax=Phtheirospermum japonicum TaxID=374723 RepID=A0A830BTM2_9LAMI|nr:hypothetical protein PHJA_001274700 [Phtheirospermum japonicum]
MGIGDELKVEEHEKSIRFAIEERGNKQQALVLVETKGEGEIPNVEVHVPDVVIGEYDEDAEKANRDMPMNILGKMHLDASGAINPSTIRYLRELKIELNEFKKCFVVKPDEEFRWSFYSSMLDYAARRRFDFKNVFGYEENMSSDGDDDQDFSDDDDQDEKHYKPREVPSSQLFHVMTREDIKDEITIWVQEVTPILANFDEAHNQSFIRFVFSLLINDKGTCLKFRCFAYPDGKITIEALEIVDDWKFKDYVIAGERADATFLDGKGVSHTLDLNPNDDGRAATSSLISAVILSESMFAPS